MNEQLKGKIKQYVMEVSVSELEIKQFKNDFHIDLK